MTARERRLNMTRRIGRGWLGTTRRGEIPPPHEVMPVCPKCGLTAHDCDCPLGRIAKPVDKGTP